MTIEFQALKKTLADLKCNMFITVGGEYSALKLLTFLGH
jgi:hypothetical protein